MRRWMLFLLACLLMTALAYAESVGGLGKGEEVPTLYELTAHSDLVVAARVLSGQIKLAQVQVEEVFRGATHPGQRLQIAFRDLNLDLRKRDRILFTDGDTEILFLVPELNWEGGRKGEDRFTLYRGRFGKVTLPREGDEIYREALRVFASLASEKDHRKLYADIRSLLGSPNPILADTGLKETLRLDLMDRSLLPRVLSYLEDSAPARRAQALRLLEKFFRSLGPENRSQELQDEALSRVLSMARNDSDEEARGAAVEALGAWGGDEVRSTLEAVATQDLAQGVRFKAKVILLRRTDDKVKTRAPANGDR